MGRGEVGPGGKAKAGRSLQTLLKPLSSLSAPRDSFAVQASLALGSGEDRDPCLSHSGFLICKTGGNLVPQPSRIVSELLPCPRPGFPHPHHGAFWDTAMAGVAHPMPVCFEARNGHLTLPPPCPFFNILCCRTGPTVTATGHTDSAAPASHRCGGFVQTSGGIGYTRESLG